MKNQNSLSLAVALGVTLAASAQAQNIISWNIDNNGTIGGGGTATGFGDHGTGGAGDFAGVFDAEYWGNSWSGVSENFNPTNLADNTGVATTLDVTSNSTITYSANGFVNPGADSDGKYNRALLAGYQNNFGGQPVTFDLSEIPYSQYDIYVYFISDDGTRVGDVTVDGITFYFGVDAASASANPATFTQTSDTTTAGYDTDANYAVFSGLTGASQSITVNIWTDNTATVRSFGGISGFQVVNTSVLSEDPEITQQPQGQAVGVEYEASFSVTAFADPAPNSYQWQFSTDDVDENYVNISGATSSTYTFDVDEYDFSQEGYYRCIVGNGVGIDAVSDGAFLDVIYAEPEFFIQPVGGTFASGSNVVLEADALTYDFPPLYQWYKDGVMIPGEDGTTLTLNDVTVADSGDYYLRVTDTVSDPEPATPAFNDSDIATLLVYDFQVTSSFTAPVTDATDQFYFPTTTSDADNIGGVVGEPFTNDAVTYISRDRVTQGMSFTTGDDPLGYTLNTIVIPQVKYSTDPTFADVLANNLFVFGFGTLSEGVKTPIYETVAPFGGVPINAGGAGGYLVFDLSGIAAIGDLDPETVYYFEVGAIPSPEPYPFIEWDGNGTSSDGYLGGEAFQGDTVSDITSTFIPLTGDRAFFVDLTGLTSEPSDDPFLGWIAGFGLDPEEQDPTDNVDVDQFDNLGEWFFFGSDPSVANSFGSSTTMVSYAGGGSFTFEHDRPLDTTGTTQTYQWTADLSAGWTNSGESDGVNTVTVTPGTTGTPANGNDAEYESVEVTVTPTVGAPDAIFVQLVVSKL